MKFLALLAIEAYQRHISPYKGFCCAYRVHTGRGGCSALGARAIRLHGVVKGLGILSQRMQLCGVAHRRHGPGAFAKAGRPPIAQRGDCDLGGCDLHAAGDCDLPGGKGVSGWCQAFSCCDACSCDWPSRDRRGKRDKKDAEVYLPPSRRWLDEAKRCVP